MAEKGVREFLKLLEKSLEELTKEISALNKSGESLIVTDVEDGDGGPLVVEADLILPEARIRGLYFNEQWLHAVFEKQGDGWWQSRDVLFMSARNEVGGDRYDALTEYLNDDKLKQQLADLFVLSPSDITVGLPQEYKGVKKYHGVACDYWLSERFPIVHRGFKDDRFYVSERGGYVYDALSNKVFGCSPAFHVASGV
jgi:hypothetical protein